MRKILTLCYTLAIMVGLTASAYADMIPIAPPEAYAGGWIALLFVVTVVVITADLLRRFWRRK